uniref:Uncharacterized protein n=1 Tax=Setaria italica TaxID=4555 RepID=K3Y403_SETIT
MDCIPILICTSLLQTNFPLCRCRFLHSAVLLPCQTTISIARYMQLIGNHQHQVY